MERESANLWINQPKWRGNQPTSENISQSVEGISQPPKISAKVEVESANLWINQPKCRGNQPTSRNISQSVEGISQPPEISAKVEEKSAKARKYQPKWRKNQPNLNQSNPTTQSNTPHRPIPTTKKHHSIKTIKVVQ
ncbi:hypothetical protein [Niallia circulans]|uniref:hypothetical protein n=1 Tax=Niallia circulans TaxID=1397 RepID=UPI00352EF142